MTPEQLVPNRETCERLKEKGFQQETYFHWVQKNRPTSGRATDDDREVVLYDETEMSDYTGRWDEALCAAPTAAELLEELKERGALVVWSRPGEMSENGCYNAWPIGDDGLMLCSASTAAQALAELWLKVRESDAERT